MAGANPGLKGKKLRHFYLYCLPRDTFILCITNKKSRKLRITSLFIKQSAINQCTKTGHSDMKYCLLSFSHASMFCPKLYVFLVYLTDELKLTNNWDDFPNQSMGLTEIDGMNEKDEMELTDNCMDVLGFEPEEKQNIYQVVAAVMHLGTMKFKQRGREEQAEADGTKVIFQIL